LTNPSSSASTPHQIFLLITMTSVFRTHDVVFCQICGALLPPLPPSGPLRCLVCKAPAPIEQFSDVETKYTIVFNKRENFEKKKKVLDSDEEDEADGPIVERTCPKCGHGRMSYAALQLRSADEGQTVFFTCLKCKHKESENS